ncbi:MULTISPECIES: 50S ribosomal protein L30 [Dethiosulfovibrio]|jgi:large subunit ribosomal protein L30|uniref:50S ribosomal protein L30 n=3 Tax=Dethiosulfovibrio TaxID=47054 RepID=D2Z931_9BACT|nr:MULTISPECIES: 50S ribosomal protein L30 [Dethiosulfovibrio]MEA3285506.1 50S ribosomal protein L30 [Synergistota bacterium]EFC91978.1 ribosomal protein L30 [Dethiosulfovibrio peptidovorans DSM 11002]MCF4113024.1 50S ribosomal protein L30 [Dethiosulfovibrio russensis]MCF4141488.1 50S ribosomal protein L30 [Dethiosulfovibrio marinus]MCF4144444.1 50S ribosomal protein L30 [Dethiosulfovibrio acidaminovorans]
MAKLIITWKRSTIGRPPKQERTVKALGLKKLNSTVIHEDTPQIRGMVAKVAHLVECSTVEE